MTVADFPRPEPWPDELFDAYGLADLQQLQRDVTEAIARRQGLPVAACPDCAAAVHPTATRCEDCGTHLSPSNATGPAREPLDEDSVPGQEVNSMTHEADCTCNRCYLEQLDDPFLRSAELSHGWLTAIGTTSNVVDLHGHSKKVR